MGENHQNYNNFPKTKILFHWKQDTFLRNKILLLRMCFISLPVELQLLVMTFLPTRDVVVLGHACRRLQRITRDRWRWEKEETGYIQTTQKVRKRHRASDAWCGELEPLSWVISRQRSSRERTQVILELLFRLQTCRDIDNCLHPWTSFISNLGITSSPLTRVNHAGHWNHDVSSFSECPLRER